jgi:hypothetical protein
VGWLLGQANFQDPCLQGRFAGFGVDSRRKLRAERESTRLDL